MTRQNLPASPQEELDRYRSAAAGGAMLTPEIRAYIESGLDISIGVRAPDGRPLAGRAAGVRLDGADLRITVSDQTYGDMIAAVAAGSPIAVTFSRAIDHRSIQVKAPGARILPPDAGDFAAAARDAAHFRDELVSVGYEPAWAGLFMAYDRHRLQVLAFTPQAAFTQTPGPGAGEELRR